MARDPDVVSLRARWLGEHMRGLRDEHGLTLRYVAGHLDVEFGTLAGFEHGRYVLTRYQLSALLDLYYEVDFEDRRRWLGLAQAVWDSRSEIDFDGAVPDEAFADLLWLEATATAIDVYSPVGIPELLHSSEYAERYVQVVLGRDVPVESVAARVSLAAQRQQVLHRALDPPQVRVVLDECVLRHPAGGQQVWAAQLEHLATLAALPNVHIQVLAAEAPRPLEVHGAFTVFTLDQPHPAQVVHIEYLGGRLLLDDGPPTGHLRAFERVQYTALDVDASAALITRSSPPLPLTLIDPSGEVN